MVSTPSTTSLALVALAALALAFAGPLHLLLGLDFVLVLVSGQWQIGGVLVDPTDLVFGALFLGLLLRGRGKLRGFFAQLPYEKLWLLLGLLLSIAYLVAPENQPNLTDPVRIAYQLYRYCWKTILYLPLTTLLLREEGRARTILLAILVGGDLCALEALPQGAIGRASGPFPTGNSLGAALIVPFLVALAGLVAPGARRWRWLFGASFLLLGRALLYAGSRGAFMGIAAGTTLLLWRLSLRSAGRSRLMRLVPVALVACLVVLAWKPDLFERPNVKRLLTASDPMEAGTFQWRIHERWPHFWAKAEAHPLFGTGTDVDMTLGPWANTPHNGYLSLAVISGIPVALLYLLFGLLAIRNGLKRFRRAASLAEGATPLLIACSVLGLLIHNSVDGALLIPFVRNGFWCLVGLSTFVGIPRPAPTAIATPAPPGPAGTEQPSAGAAPPARR